MDDLEARYELLDLLGRGRHAEVWRARHRVIGTSLAIKRWHPSPSGRPPAAVVERFVREVKAQAQLDHPGIARVLDAGFDDADRPFVVMDELVGETLADRLAHGPLSMAEVLATADELLEVLAAAHTMGLVHRDLRPENVFLCASGRSTPRVKLLDFGLVLPLHDALPRVTPPYLTCGTPAYMAPEHFSAPELVGAAADVWSVGAVLYEAVVGRPPFQGASMAALIDAIRAGRFAALESVAPHVPAAVTAVVSRCLRVSPAERYANAGVVQFALLAAREKAGLGPSRPRAGRGFAIAALALTALSALALLGTNSILVPIVTGQWEYVGYTVMNGTLTPAFRIGGGVGLAAAALCGVLAVIRWRSRAPRS